METTKRYGTSILSDPIRRKKKIRSSRVMIVNIKVLKKMHRNHTKETDKKLKIEEM